MELRAVTDKVKMGSLILACITISVLNPWDFFLG
jgi:hypothetical protein